MPLVREPLLHFFLLGWLVFLFYSWSTDDQWRTADEIVIDQRRIDALSAQFEMVRQRPPTNDELKTLLVNWVREELLYREGLANGLDKDDPVVRRRVAQNMDILVGASGPGTPSEEELHAWFEANAEDYLTPGRYWFRQVFFDPGHDGDHLSARVAVARERLLAGNRRLVGDPTLLPHENTEMTLAEIAKLFGKTLATELKNLPPNEWVGPVESAYGLHLVRIERVTEGRLPPLQDIRSRVETDYHFERSRQTSDDFYRALRSRYSIKVEAGPVAASEL